MIRDEVITISYELSRVTRILKQVFGYSEQLRKNAEEILRKQERIKKQILRIDIF